MENFSFPVYEQKAYGSIFYPEIKKEVMPAVLFIHGWDSNGDKYIPIAKELSRYGFVSMNFDLRGHGKSDGDINILTRQDYLSDAMGAYDYLTNLQNVNKSAVGVFGSSFGGYIAILLCNKRPVKWLALRAPSNYPNEGFENIAQSKYTIDNPTVIKWRQGLMSFNNTRSLQILHEFTNDILIIESENDTEIPHQLVLNYIDALSAKENLKHVIIKGAQHSLTDPKHIAQLQEIVVNWFSSKAS